MLVDKLRTNLTEENPSNETETRYYIVDTIIDEVNFDTALEYETGQGPVDYALFEDKTKSKPDILIEAKSLGSNLKPYKSQLTKYANTVGDTSGILTDGKKYWIYEDQEWEKYNIVDTRIESKFKSIFNPESSDIDTDVMDLRDVKSLVQHNESMWENIINQSIATALSIQPLSFETEKPLHIRISQRPDINRLIIKLFSERSDTLVIDSIRDDIDYPKDTINRIVINTNTDIPPEEQLPDEINIDVETRLPESIPTLLLSEPEYGNFDEYEPLGEQMVSYEHTMFDLVFTNMISDGDMFKHASQGEYVSTIKFKNINPTKVPTPNTDTEMCEKHITQFIEKLSELDSVYTTIFVGRVLETVAVLFSHIENESKVNENNIERAIDIFRASLHDIGIEVPNGDYGRRNTDTEATTREQKIQKLGEIIKSLTKEYPQEGVPFEEIVEQAEDVGFDLEETKEMRDELRSRGELFNISNNRWTYINRS